MLYAVCAILALCASGDEPQEAVTLGPKELTIMLGKGEEREKLLKEHHGRQVRLTGKVTVRDDRVEVWVSDRKPAPTQALVPVLFADVATRDKVKQLVEQNTAQRRDTVLTVAGEAVFTRTVLKPSPAYVVPEALKPRGPGVQLGKGPEAWEKLQRAMAEAEELQMRILADARRKGQVVTAQDYGLYGLNEARIETPAPKKIEVPRPDPEKTAAARLTLAQQLLEGAKTRDAGIARLKELVREYPDTKAAEEARKLLKKN